MTAQLSPNGQYSRGLLPKRRVTPTPRSQPNHPLRRIATQREIAEPYKYLTRCSSSRTRARQVDTPPVLPANGNVPLRLRARWNARGTSAIGGVRSAAQPLRTFARSSRASRNAVSPNVSWSSSAPLLTETPMPDAWKPPANDHCASPGHDSRECDHDVFRRSRS